MGMSSFSFGMILLGMGVVVYYLNRILKPDGWARTEPKPEPELAS